MGANNKAEKKAEKQSWNVGKWTKLWSGRRRSFVKEQLDKEINDARTEFEEPKMPNPCCGDPTCEVCGSMDT